MRTTAHSVANLAATANRLGTGLPVVRWTTFGEAIFELRRRSGRSQAAVAAAASLSSGYYSELENCRRVAPSRKTALRIGRALQLKDPELNGLLALAAAERAGLHDQGLPSEVRDLIGAIRIAAPRLTPNLVDALYTKVREVCM
jgi:transcriptional regulator with XRE-family HTH domain